MIINMWSGPRNLSTVLMRSFENRNDTKVWDEPLYAYFLKKTKNNHPMANEIIKSYNHNINELIKYMTTEVEKNKIHYLKHMSHHLLNEIPFTWIKKGKNCFLIRKPEKVISSYIIKNKLNNSYDLGFPTQYKIFKYLKKNNQEIIIINSDDLIKNSKKILRLFCKKLNIEFTNKMLTWPKGSRDSDGIWGKIWYEKVINSNSFSSNISKKKISIPLKYNKILQECNNIYEELNYYSLKG